MDKTKLIIALRASAEALRGGCEYEWRFSYKCNMGILAKELLGVQCFPSNPVWSDARRDEKAVCLSTKLPMFLVFAELYESGLRSVDVFDLENLANIEVRDRAGITDSYSKDDREDVILYMDAWADILEEEQNVQELLKVQGVPASEQAVRLSAISSSAEPQKDAAAILNAALV